MPRTRLALANPERARDAAPRTVAPYVPLRAAVATALLVAAAACGGGGGGGAGSTGGGGTAEPAGNHPPVAQTMSVSARANAPRTFALDASDVDGDALTFRVTSGPYHGTATVAGGQLVYTPATGYVGDDMLLYQVNDGWRDATYTGAVYLTIYEATHNAAPAASDLDLWTAPDTALTFDVPLVDADGDPLVVTVRGAPRHGTLTGTGSRRTYVPAAGFVGTDLVVFDADDARTTSTARVAISVGARPSFSPMSEEERTGAMDAISALRLQLDPSTDASLEQLEGAIRALPGVAYVGRNATGVWGQFRDGAAFIVGTAVPPGPVDALPPRPAAPAAALASPRLSGVPTGARALVINALPLTPHFGPNKGAEVKPLLEAAGYTVDPPIDAAQLSHFEAVKDYSVVYVRSHGGSGQAWDPTTATTGLGIIPSIWTATPATAATRMAYLTDILAQRVTFMNEVVDANIFSKTTAWHLGLSPLFIRQHWRLKPGAYVHLSACWLGNPYGQASPNSGLAPGLLHNAFFAKGAALVGGWSRATLVGSMDRAAAFAFDRMAGANLTEPKEDPPQRPMGAKTVLADMYRRGLATSYVSDTYMSEFRFILPQRAGGVFTTDRLAPSIAHLEPEPATMKLKVYGDLGALSVDPAKVRVSIDGAEYAATVRADHVQCDLPPNASGDVVVTVDGRRSNRVRLGRWDGTLTYRITGPGTLSQVFTYTVKLVGDVHEYRTASGKPPEARRELYVPMLAQGSSGSYTVAGQNADADRKVTWEGNGTITPHVDASTCDGCFSFTGKMFPEARGYLWWNIFTGIQRAYDLRLYTWDRSEWSPAGGGMQPVMFPYFSGMNYSGPLPAGMFALKGPVLVGADGTIPGSQVGPEPMARNGVQDFTGWPIQHELSWGTMTPVPGSEIDPQMPR